jgi:outer membrane protein assembly factor BamB
VKSASILLPCCVAGLAVAADPPLPGAPRIEKLWERAIRAEGAPLMAEGVVLFPCGLQVVALDAQTGAEAWRYSFEEERGGLKVPARIQALGAVRLRPGQGIAIAIGSTEIHGLAFSSGRVLWKHQERLCCTLALSIVGDFDGDGVRDAVSSGCNSVVCVSSASGAALWEFPVSGRSWWTADAGDLDGDGISEVLVHAMGTVHAARSAGASGADRLWSLALPMQPRSAFPVAKGVVLLFPTGAVERRSSDGAVAWKGKIPDGKVADACTSADRRYLLVVAGGAIARLALEDGTLEMLGRTEARAGAVQPERGCALLGFEDGTVAVFDCATRAERARTKVTNDPIETILRPANDFAVALTAGRAIGVRLAGGAAKP